MSVSTTGNKLIYQPNTMLSSLHPPVRIIVLEAHIYPSISLSLTTLAAEQTDRGQVEGYLGQICTSKYIKGQGYELGRKWAFQQWNVSWRSKVSSSMDLSRRLQTHVKFVLGMLIS